jgi:hypothetical protein
MQVVYERCAGLDMHKKTVSACASVCDAGASKRQQTRTFGTFTGDLLELADWLREQGGTHVAMEATGVYWRPVWAVLEGQFEQMLVNPQHIQAVPGRKTDTKDCEWIAELKHDLAADRFCLKQFVATEAAFHTILLLFNLLAEFQRATGLPGYREPATLRTMVFTCGAILGRAGSRIVLHLSKSWGGLKTRNPLIDSIFKLEFPTSPKLQLAPAT